jgi:hypothetical protein
MIIVNKIFLISLFITVQTFALDDSYEPSIVEQAWTTVSNIPSQAVKMLRDAMKMLLVAPDSMMSGKGGSIVPKEGLPVPVLPVIPTPDIPVFPAPNYVAEFEAYLRNFNEGYIQPAWGSTQDGLASIQTGLNKAAAIVPQKAAELKSAAKNNPYKTIVILGGIIGAGMLAKKALKSKKNDEKMRTKITLFKIDTERNPVVLAGQAIALGGTVYAGYKMKNNIANFCTNLFTKKAASA